jgi:hypothetical protein
LGIAKADKHIDFLRNQFICQRRDAITAPVGPGKGETNITAILPPKLLHVAPQGLCKGLRHIWWVEAQHSHHGQQACLCKCRERPGDHGAAEMRNKVPPPHLTVPMKLMNQDTSSLTGRGVIGASQ